MPYDDNPMLDLYFRLQRAANDLRELGEQADDRGDDAEATRLWAKREGVRLAQSYCEEYRR